MDSIHFDDDKNNSAHQFIYQIDVNLFFHPWNMDLNTFFFSKLMRSIIIVAFMLKVSPLPGIRELESFEWLTDDGESRPTIKMIDQNETIMLPLQEAPYCRLWKTHKCDCFILRRGLDKSYMERASFVKCNEKVRGSLVSMTNYFEIAPKEMSDKHTIKEIKLEKNFGSSDVKVQIDETEKDGVNFKYLKPLPEYGNLLDNETGFVVCLFAVSELVFETISELSIDSYLQNLVNDASRYFIELDLMIVYGGWTLALLDDTHVNDKVTFNITRGGGYKYDKGQYYDIVVLFAPGKI